MILDSLHYATGQSISSLSHWVIGISVTGFALAMGAMVYLSKRD